MLKLKPENVPLEMQEINQWVLWRADRKGDKVRKVPVHPQTLQATAPSNSDIWLSFEDAVDAIALVDGIGLYLTEDIGIACVDVDNSMDLTEVGIDSFTELSPSGKGLHVWCFADIGAVRKDLGKYEIYSDGAFVTVTGHRVSTSNVYGLVDATERLADMLEEAPKALFLPKLEKLLEKRYVRDLWDFGKSYINLGGRETADHSRADLAIAGIAVEEGWSDKEIEALLREYRRRAKLQGFPVSKQKMEGRSDYYRRTLDAARGRLSERIRAWEVYTLDQVFQLPEPSWVIEDVLPTASFSMLWGNFGVGKTFIALDMCFKLIHDMDWFGHDVDGGDILYILGEGKFGLKPRTEAWFQHHVLDEKPNHRILFRTHATQLADPRECALMTSVIRQEMNRPRLIVIDTLSRAMVGVDENDAESMTRIVNNITDVIAATEISVLVLHHSTKATETARGSSVLIGAVDSSIEVKQLQYKYKTAGNQKRFSIIEGAYEFINEKNRYGDKFESKCLYLKPVSLSEDRTSVIVQQSPAFTKWINHRGVNLFGLRAEVIMRIWELHCAGVSNRTIASKLGDTVSTTRIEHIVQELKGNETS